jgi:hypothetical protein
MAKSAKSAPAKGDISLPVKGGGGPVQKYKPSPKYPSPKKEGERNKPKIVNLMYPDGTCCGWAFHNFYDAKEELKSLPNRDGMVTCIGGIEFRPFSNLTTKWLKEAEFSRWIWVIRIDADLDGTEHCFPLTAHEAYGKKTARGVIAQNIWEKDEVHIGNAILTHAEAHDFDECFSVVPHDAAGDDIFNEAIRAADSALEDLI